MANKQKILIVEDEESIRIGLCDLFAYHGYEVEWEDDGGEALKKTHNSDYDLIILDVMLPSLDGFSLCQKIKENKKDQAVIMLTAKSTEEDRILGLSLGADDYVCKPFSIRELVLRVEAVLRRCVTSQAVVCQLQIGNYLLIDTKLLVGKDFNTGVEKELFSRREVDILLYLHRYQTRYVSRDELLAEVWGYEKAASIETRTVDIHIAKLRRKIEPSAKDPQYLVTNRGEGYRLVSSQIIE
jgi:DNA-binding response OmpR family regulator